MARIVSGPYVSGRVVAKQTGTPISGVTVTVSPAVYTTVEMASSTTSLTTDGAGVFVCYALPGLYTFTTTAVDAAPIEPVEILGAEGLGADRAAGVVVAGDIGGTPTAPTVPRARLYTADNGLFVSTAGNDSNDGLSPGAALATLDAAIAKLPTPNFAFGPTRRGYLISMMPGDYTLAGPLTVKKGPNLEIRGVGSRGQAATPGYGGTNVFTPVGQVGLTIGQRNSGDTAWASVKTGVVLRNLHFAAAATDTGSTEGLKIIGLSNCSFYDVTVSGYNGTGSVGWHMQSSPIANGGSGGSTSYDTFYSCAANDCKTGLWLNGQTANLIGFLADGGDDNVTTYQAGSTAMLLDNGGSAIMERPIIQAYAIGIDDSQAHSAGVLYSLVVIGAHLEAVGTGIVSNQIGTVISGGTLDNSNLSGGTAGTVGVQMNSGALGFVAEGLEMGAVETKWSVNAAASGWRRDSTGLYVYGTGSGRGLPTYNGAAPSGVIQSPAGTGATFGSFSTGSTDMAGQFTLTTGTTPGAGNLANITFANAFGAGVVPVIACWATSTTSVGTAFHSSSVSNTGFSIHAPAAPAASTAYTFQYAVLGTHT